MKFTTILTFASVASAIKVSEMGYWDTDNESLAQASAPAISFTTKGSGSKCTEGQEAAVQYTGSLISNGSVFDSSIPRGEAFKFTIGNGAVIKCWDQALTQLSVGDKADVSCPASLAYGDQAMGDAIPANSDLKFAITVESCGE